MLLLERLGGNTMKTWVLRISCVLAMAICIAGITAGGVFAEEGKVSQEGEVTSYTPPSQGRGEAAIDFENAIPMPLPQATISPSTANQGAPPVKFQGSPGYSPGSRGDQKVAPTVHDTQNVPGEQIEGRQEYGTNNHPFTTSRVDLGTSNAISKLYPFRATGKLYFNIGASTYICSASLIKKGIIVTAAHCVANFGHSTFYTNWQYVPALYNTTKPYKTWNTVNAYVMTSYFNGTDSCSVSGVVCQNDVAVLVAKPVNGKYPGQTTGWFAYGWDGYGFTTDLSPNVALINQLGYPKSHDGGLKMQRTDSQGYVNAGLSNNTVWGSRQTGGSSGGPELVNLGELATLSDGVSVGEDASRNIVVGVTSWGYSDNTVKEQGASPFTSSNIGVLVNAAACTTYPNACLP